MAALDFIVNSGNVTLSATPNTAKTVLQLVAATNHRIRVKGYSITVGGTSPVDLTVRIGRSTTNGTGTQIDGTSANISKLEPAAAETVQTDVFANFTVEPTFTSIISYKRLQGSYEVIFPLGQEIIVDAGKGLSIECSSASASTVVSAEFRCEE